MNQKKIAIGILLLVLVATFSGCISKDSTMLGTYRCEVDDGVLDLLEGKHGYENDEGRYEMLDNAVSDSSGSFGRYTVRDGTVRLKMEFLGIIIPFVIDGRDLIDPDGDRWVRD